MSRLAQHAARLLLLVLLAMGLWQGHEPQSLLLVSVLAFAAGLARWRGYRSFAWAASLALVMLLAVAAGEMRIAIPLSMGGARYAAVQPALLLMAFALLLVLAKRQERRPRLLPRGPAAALHTAAAMAAALSVLAYLLLSPRFDLDPFVLRKILANLLLLLGAYQLLSRIRPAPRERAWPALSLRLPWVPRLPQTEAAGRIVLLAAIVLLPLGGKLPGFPLSLSDVFLLPAALLMGPALLREGARIDGDSGLRWPAALVLIACFGACTATAPGEALKELAQLLVYCGLAVLLLNHSLDRAKGLRQFRAACMAGALLGALLLIIGPAFDTPLAACTILLAAIALGGRRAPQRLAAGLCLCLALAAHARDMKAPPIPQRYLEGYAALSTLSEHPVFGVGPGNYQARIGQYYQGMPKENTITPGTRIGYGVLLASLGLAGCAALMCWRAGIWRRASRPLRFVLLLWIVAGFFTPLFVGQLLLPLALLHALAHRAEGGQHA